MYKRQVLDYIPIANTVKAFFLQLKYKIYKDNEEVGKACFYGFSKNKNERDFFVINGKKYFCCQGNTDFIRPLKKYSWTCLLYTSKQRLGIAIALLNHPKLHPL